MVSIKNIESKLNKANLQYDSAVVEISKPKDKKTLAVLDKLEELHNGINTIKNKLKAKKVAEKDDHLLTEILRIQKMLDNADKDPTIKRRVGELLAAWKVSLDEMSKLINPADRKSSLNKRIKVESVSFEKLDNQL